MRYTESELEAEKEVLRQLKGGSIPALLLIYRRFGQDLLLFAYTLLQDRKKAALTTDRLFEELWLSFRFEEIQPPLYKYLTDRIRNFSAGS